MKAHTCNYLCRRVGSNQCSLKSWRHQKRWRLVERVLVYGAKGVSEGIYFMPPRSTPWRSMLRTTRSGKDKGPPA